VAGGRQDGYFPWSVCRCPPRRHYWRWWSSAIATAGRMPARRPAHGTRAPDAQIHAAILNV
jgi:hypothetical protein